MIKGKIKGLFMDNDKIKKLKIDAIKKLSVDDKIEILGSMMDTIMKIKVELIKQRYNMTDEEAMKFLRTTYKTSETLGENIMY